jgi:hypothetical protein
MELMEDPRSVSLASRGTSDCIARLSSENRSLFRSLWSVQLSRAEPRSVLYVFILLLP